MGSLGKGEGGRWEGGGGHFLGAARERRQEAGEAGGGGAAVGPHKGRSHIPPLFAEGVRAMMFHAAPAQPSPMRPPLIVHTA